MPTSTATQTSAATNRYTYTCLDCAFNAGERRWDTLADAARAATRARTAHADQCRARLVVVSLPTTATSYGPDDLIPIPAWAATIARSLTAAIAHRAAHGYVLDFADPNHATLIAEAALAFNPIPGQPTPADADQLATLLRRTSDAITASAELRLPPTTDDMT
ncbi:hypothetical protein QTQ03_28445 [Micromonospora sp. WMMA1363]|uniref:hypothetical protein n=1 Tax=Micromonospora sp. WMMA1363 TaxID=3053985 RepID=UPI00259CC546|nr:hypothetical protein [Micromonospora sp. WMMA1363]MDM4723337.1 hypothetical protein [Micromonospora sp. WMMA1363]